MKAAKIKTAPVFDSYSWKQLGIITYGETNDFPQTIDELIKASKTGTACLDIKDNFVDGMGFRDKALGSLITNDDGLTLSKLRRFLTRDLNQYNGIALHFNYNVRYEITSITPIPFEELRLALPNDEGKVCKIAHHPDWGRRQKWRWNKIQAFSKEICWYDVFNPDPEEIAEQVSEAGGWDMWKGQIMYFTGTEETGLCYPIPKYVSVLTDMRTEEGLSNVSARNVCSNFMTAGILVDVLETEQDEAQIQAKQQQLDQFQGDEMAMQLWYMQVRNKDEIPVFVPFSGENYDKAFSQSQAVIPDTIGQAFKQPPVLRAKDVGANFGSDLITNSYKYYNSVTTTERRQIKELLEEVFALWWEPMPEDTDFNVIPLVYNAGASLVERLGQPVMQQILDVIHDEVLPRDNKYNILLHGFGLHDSEINDMLP